MAYESSTSPRLPGRPSLVRVRSGGVAFWTDEALRERLGVVVTFSERSGGVSRPPFAELNLAGHVGDESRAVDENRTRLLAALGLAAARERLTLATQVHGDAVEVIGPDRAGSGAWTADGPESVPACDALITRCSGVPLLMCFADCVPVVLVAPGPVVAVVHAGWRGALLRLPLSAVVKVSQEAGCDPARITAYVGAHIGPCHYETDAGIMSRFADVFGTVAGAESGGLDLGAVVRSSLTCAGVDPRNIACLRTCTAEATDRFFSYRAEGGVTGRHGALVCVLPRRSSVDQPLARRPRRGRS